MCWFCLVVDALYVVHTTKQSRIREITKSLDVIVTPLSKLGEVALFIAYPPPLCTVTWFAKAAVCFLVIHPICLPN